MRSLATRHRWPTCACALAALALLHLVVPGRAAAQTISHTWEDGTLEGWTPRGGVNLVNSTEAAATGTHSLKTTGRTATWQGPSLNLLSRLVPGTIYQVKVAARLSPGEAPTQLKLTVQSTTRDGDSYTQVAATSATGATEAAWVTLQGSYTVPYCLTALVVYVESSSATASFSIDDFSITVVPLATCSDSGGLHSDFETGTTEGWFQRGPGSLTATNADSHGGSYSLRTSGRTGTWNGPAIDVTGKMCKGSRYAVSVWAKLAPGATATQLRVSVQRNLGSVQGYSTILGNKTVRADGWVQFSGTYDWTADYTSLSLYVESNSDPTVSFYVDDFELSWAASLNPGLVPAPYCPSGPPIADGLDKFLGCAYSGTQRVNFTAYWNQVTPENGGKWGTVEGTRNTMSWGEMDAAYALAKANHVPIKLHTLVWGSQQPGWIAALAPDQQLAEINEWFAKAAERFPDVDQVDVVNEPLHAIPSYVNALGGSGATGWDWVVAAFRMARTYFPKAQLLINEYSVTNSTSDMHRYIGIIKLLQAEHLVDGVGVQGHYFSTKSYSGDLPATSAQQKANLDLLAAETGLPVYVTEMDIDGPTDELQLSEYQRIFPIFWEHPAVKGITLWGYRPGLWRANAFLAYDNGGERPAFVWMQNYVQDKRPGVSAGQSFAIDGGACNVIGIISAADPDAGTRPDLAVLEWKIVGGNGEGIFAIDPATGSLGIAKPLAIDFARTSYELSVQVSDGFKASEPQAVTITIPAKITLVHKGRVLRIAKEDVPDHLRDHGDCLGTPSK